MADPNGYLAGDNVQLIKGTYRLFRKGVYKRPATEKSAVVEINGKERTIRYSSFKKMTTTTSRDLLHTHDHRTENTPQF